LAQVAALVQDEIFEQVAKGVPAKPGICLRNGGPVQIDFAGRLQHAQQLFVFNDKRLDDVLPQRMKRKIISLPAFVLLAITGVGPMQESFAPRGIPHGAGRRPPACLGPVNGALHGWGIVVGYPVEVRQTFQDIPAIGIGTVGEGINIQIGEAGPNIGQIGTQIGFEAIKQVLLCHLLTGGWQSRRKNRRIRKIRRICPNFAALKILRGQISPPVHRTKYEDEDYSKRQNQYYYAGLLQKPGGQ
jgi:hypothetical protein